MTNPPCHGRTDLFFPEGRGNESSVLAGQAKLLCAGCFQRQECLDGAIERREKHGIWGGTSQKDRRVIIRKLNRGELE